VDPAHIGTAGRGLKAPDFWALPVLHSIHADMHARGEMSVIRDIIPDDVLRAALRALAKQMYGEWQSDTEADGRMEKALFENRPILAKT
jgi:hypothetical protein